MCHSWIIAGAEAERVISLVHIRPQFSHISFSIFGTRFALALLEET
jgi:hypothetical protein